jgi:hypothetical protein
LGSATHHGEDWVRSRSIETETETENRKLKAVLHVLVDDLRAVQSDNASLRDQGQHHGVLRAAYTGAPPQLAGVAPAQRQPALPATALCPRPDEGAASSSSFDQLASSASEQLAALRIGRKTVAEHQPTVGELAQRRIDEHNQAAASSAVHVPAVSDRL